MKSFILIQYCISIYCIFFSMASRADIPILRSLLPDFKIIYQEGQTWAPTDYTGQGQALGLTPEAFVPSTKLEKAVQFWIRVYTEFKSSQGVLHDLDNLSVVYEKVDFDFIDNNSSLTDLQKSKARENLIEERKKTISATLKKISINSDSEEFSDFEKNIKNLWKGQGGSQAIKEASDLDRIRFQLGQSDRMKEAIFLSGRYLPMMEEIFKREGLPLQLTRLVFVESSFNVLARSKVGASGLWQIMPSAARGRLKVNSTVDLRNHPQKATQLAAKMLKFNFEMLGSWPLAITGYNHGPYGVKRLVERNKTHDLGELIETGEGRRFGFASRNFYASFLAALEVESKALIYFPGIKQDHPFQLSDYIPTKPIYFKDLVEAFGGNKELAQLYNPHLQRAAYLNRVTLDHKSYLVIPTDKIDIARTELNDLKSEKESTEIESKKSKSKFKIARAIAAASVKKIAVKEESDSAEQKSYKVNRGDTLYRISKQFGVSIKSILALNDLKRPRIKTGQILLIP